MLKNLIKFLFVETIIFALIIGLTKGELIFNVSDSQTLTPELIKSSHNISYDKNYIIEHPMKYLIPIESEDGTKVMSLIWPTEPFGRFLILAASQSEDINTQTHFEGRLVRCIYKCLPNEISIEMFPFVEMIEKQFPKLKGKYSQLPSIIIDTTVVPNGLKGYFYHTKLYWSVFAFCLTLGGFWMLKTVITGKDIS